MDDWVCKLTGEQALEIVRRLAAKQGVVSEAVEVTAKELLTGVNMEEVASEVFWALESIDVQDCWDRAGGSRYGYTSPEEAAMELVEEELQVFVDQVNRYHDLSMVVQERLYCMGIVLGAYRYVQESKSEFKDWCEDVPIECAGGLLDTWRKRTPDTSSLGAMDDFIELRCPKWAQYLICP